MSRPVFDMNVFIEYKNFITDYHFAKMALSTVWRKVFTELNRFLVPAAEDWWQSGKIASRIRHGEKSKAKGRTPKNPHTQELQNDILIARTAFARKFFVVTSNTEDFRKIRQFLDVEVVSAKEYFETSS